jgi:hypothetical protein
MLTLGFLFSLSASDAGAAGHQPVDFLGGEGVRGGQFGQAAGVAVNQAGAGPAEPGDIYVTDLTIHRIERFARNDNGTPSQEDDDTYSFVSAWGAGVEPKAGPGYEVCTVAEDCNEGIVSGVAGGLSTPSGIAVDQDTGEVYVADPGNVRIDVYEGDGTFLRAFGYDVVQSGPDDNGAGYEVCVPASGDVCKAGISGAGVGQIDGPIPFGRGDAMGVAVSQPNGNAASGTVFLADRGNSRVDTYHLDGSSPASIGSAAVFSAAFEQPRQVAVDSRGILYASNGHYFNASVERYDTENADGEGVGFLAPISAPANEQDGLRIKATSGQFRLSFDPDEGGPEPAQLTPSLPLSVTAEQIKAALEALPGIGAGNIERVGTSSENGHPIYEVTFGGALAHTNLPPLTVVDGSEPISPAGSVHIDPDLSHNGADGPLTQNEIYALYVEPDLDGAGPDTDVLDVLLEGNIIDQFGPVNQPGLSSPPTALDAAPDVEGLSTGSSLASDEASGRLYLATLAPELGAGVAVLGTPGPGPSATLDSFSDQTPTSITAHATITPNGPPALKYHLEYSTDGTHWEPTLDAVLGTQKTPQSLSIALEPPGGFEPSSTYHVRLVAKRPFFPTIVTAEKTFTTPPSPPLVETTGSPVKTMTTARLDGRVDPAGTPTTYHFEYGTQGPCDANPCSSTPDRKLGPDEMQKITIRASAGQFKLSFGANTTAELPFNATAAEVRSALQALPSIGTGNVSVSGGPGDLEGTHPYLIAFTGELAATDVGEITVQSAAGKKALSSPHSATVATTQQGGGGFNETQSVTLAATGGQFKLSFSSETSADIAFNAPAATVASTLEALPSIGAGNVLVSGGPGDASGSSPYVVRFVGKFANTNVAQLGTANGTTPLSGTTEFGAVTTIPGGLSAVFLLVSAPIEGLEASTTYHYRVVADNGNPGSPVFGEDMTVTTNGAEAPLSHGHFPGPVGSDRAWEMASEPDTGGNPVGTSFAAGAAAVSDNGDRVVFGVAGGTPLSEGGTLNTTLFAERTASGWQTRNIYPSRGAATGSRWSDPIGPSDLSTMVAENDNPVFPGESSIWRFSPNSSPERLFAGGGGVWEASKDGSRVVAGLPGSHDPAHPAAPGTINLYDISSGSDQPKLVSLLPDGTVPACGIRQGGFSGPGIPRGGNQSPNWVSIDGSFAFFPSEVNNCGSELLRLYARDIPAEETKLISVPPLSGRDCTANFIKWTPSSGSPGDVYFYSESRLTADDIAPPGCAVGDSSGNFADVYRYDLGTDTLKCVTCIRPGAQLAVTFRPFAQHINESLGIAEDGSRIYFLSHKRLLPGAPAKEGTYRLDVKSGDLAYVGDFGSIGDNGTDRSQMTADGSVVVFESRDPSLNAPGGQQNGGTEQVYRYDDRDRSLICISCPPDGSLPRGDAASSGHSTSDGGDIAFTTPTPLASTDQNTASPKQKPGVGNDVYEWREGRLLLVSDGLLNWPEEGGGPQASWITPSGRDVFFTEAAELTPDALDGYKRLYDARIGGGFEFPRPPQPCPLEVCQGTPKGAPEEQAPGTQYLQGAQQATPTEGRCGKAKVRRKGRCVAKHKKQHTRKPAQHKRAKHDRRAHR